MPENIVDHIDQIKSNNVWSNLREGTQICNMQNAPLRIDNKSGVTGVSWDSKANKWFAKISIHKKYKWLGYYIKLEDAVWARYNEEQLNPLWTCSVESSAYKYLKNNNLFKGGMNGSG